MSFIRGVIPTVGFSRWSPISADIEKESPFTVPEFAGGASLVTLNKKNIIRKRNALKTVISITYLRAKAVFSRCSWFDYGKG